MMREKVPDAVTLMQYLRPKEVIRFQWGKTSMAARLTILNPRDYYNQPARKRFSGSRTPTAKDAWAPWGPLDVEESELFDVQNALAIAELGKSHEKPFFIACGFTKPHMPWYAPRKYFDLHPIEDIILPDTLDNDRDDLPYWGKRFATEVHDVSGARNLATHGEDFHDMVTKHKQWPRAVQII